MGAPVETNALVPIAAPTAALVPVQAHAGSGQYLTFSLQQEVYGLDILCVREIIGYSRPTSVPMMPPFVHGVINVRGNVVPVIDLAQRFGRTPTVLHARTCIVILEVAAGEETVHVGVLVDAVNSVLDLDSEQIEHAPTFGTGLRQDFIQGMARTDTGFIILLDVGRVLSVDEMAALTHAAHAPALPS